MASKILRLCAFALNSSTQRRQDFLNFLCGLAINLINTQYHIFIAKTPRREVFFKFIFATLRLSVKDFFNAKTLRFFEFPLRLRSLAINLINTQYHIFIAKTPRREAFSIFLCDFAP